MRQLATSLLFFAATALPCIAADYTGTLNVSIDGAAADPATTTISVDENADGTYRLSLLNFILYADGDAMPIGNIVLDNVAATIDGNVVFLQTSQDITIAAGDAEGVDTWYGPLLTSDGSSIPVSMAGAQDGDRFNTTIQISFLGMNIGVSFVSDAITSGDGYQIPNSDFELFHTATYSSSTSDEPNNWHSFMSCTGTWASTVSGVPHTFISEDVRPGTAGTKSVKLTSGIVKVFVVSIPANGTLTTGRLKAGSTSATDTNNCSFLDISSTDTDANGDPFYTELTAHPDSIKLWVKFKQGTLSSSNQQYKYATMSAAITDGTYYQDPENQTYTNIVAKAKDNQIESNDASWQELTVPFDYASYSSNGVEPKAILVTLSTNAQPGVGSEDSDNPDELYIDDLSLVYNCKLASLSVGGAVVAGFDKDTKSYNISLEGTLSASDIAAVADGQGAYASTTIENVDGGQIATITVFAEDLSASNIYTLNITDTTSGIKTLNGSQEAAPAATYSIDGKRVSGLNQKGIYIVRQANGEPQKVLKR